MSSLQPTFHRRPLPDELIAFSSTEGRRLFAEALATGGMERWFSLAEQHTTQAEPAWCGLASLVVALNAMGVDPGKPWKGPWRWYSEQQLECCFPLETLKEHGTTLEMVAGLAICQGVRVDVRHADDSDENTLRTAIIDSATRAEGPIVIASYGRAALGQTGDGHFSPIAGWHRERDLVLILDVARFKYPPHWVSVSRLFDAMRPPDPETGRSRGWLVLSQDRTVPGRTSPS